MHELKSLRDLLKRQRVSYKFIHFELLIHIVLHQFGHAFDTLVP